MPKVKAIPALAALSLSSLCLVARLSLGEGRRLRRCERLGSALAVPQGVQCPRPARVAKLDGRRIVDTDQNVNHLARESVDI
ncbi:hypothetical protein GPALN_011309 [Globodera pallida]|nr:hypothetical protein GPALN_011309 [Globodera pallida]